MNWNQATLHAVMGYTLLLPGWRGQFKWDWNKKELYFLNGDYYLTEKEIIEKGLRDREDWYYII